MDLLKKAAEILGNAHAPYSRFYVGCAVLGGSGKVFVGCNVENACLNAGLCAERTAISQAISQGEKKITKIGIINASDRPCPPCGACLQFINEFAGPDTEIWTTNKDQSKTEKYTLKQLLPVTYDKSFLP